MIFFPCAERVSLMFNKYTITMTPIRMFLSASTTLKRPLDRPLINVYTFGTREVVSQFSS